LYDEGLAGRPDADVWNGAQAELRFLITQDLDFSDIRIYKPGHHRGILLVRLQTPNRRALIQRVLNLFESEQVEEWGGCFVVATERKLRIIRALNVEAD
jgi:predicted nuclease of predicted toxin-antitoxin system